MAKILIVDDEEDIREMCRDRLEAEGYEVLTADSGRRGLEMQMWEGANLILTDQQMPEMSGFEMVEKLRGVGDNTPVVMMSAGDDGSVRKYVERRELGYLSKPFSMGDLSTKIRAYLILEEEGGV